MVDHIIVFYRVGLLAIMSMYMVIFRLQYDEDLYECVIFDSCFGLCSDTCTLQYSQIPKISDTAIIKWYLQLLPRSTESKPLARPALYI